MAASKAAQGNTAETEYTIYTFDKAKDKTPRTQWQKHDTTREMNSACSTAQTLFESGRYHRVEIKQKYFDHRIGRTVDMTCRTYEAGRRFRPGPATVIGFAMICGFAVFILAGLLGL